MRDGTRSTARDPARLARAVGPSSGRILVFAQRLQQFVIGIFMQRGWQLAQQWASKVTRSPGSVFIKPARLCNLAKNSANRLRVSPRLETAQSWARLRRRDHRDLLRDHGIAHAGFENTGIFLVQPRLRHRVAVLIPGRPHRSASAKQDVEPPSFQDSEPDTLPVLAVPH